MRDIPSHCTWFFLCEVYRSWFSAFWAAVNLLQTQIQRNINITSKAYEIFSYLIQGIKHVAFGLWIKKSSGKLEKHFVTMYYVGLTFSQRASLKIREQTEYNKPNFFSLLISFLLFPQFHFVPINSERLTFFWQHTILYYFTVKLTIL